MQPEDEQRNNGPTFVSDVPLYEDGLHVAFSRGSGPSLPPTSMSPAPSLGRLRHQNSLTGQLGEAFTSLPIAGRVPSQSHHNLASPLSQQSRGNRGRARSVSRCPPRSSEWQQGRPRSRARDGRDAGWGGEAQFQVESRSEFLQWISHQRHFDSRFFLACFRHSVTAVTDPIANKALLPRRGIALG